MNHRGEKKNTFDFPIVPDLTAVLVYNDKPTIHDSIGLNWLNNK